MPIVRVEIWDNHTKEFKKNLAKDITQTIIKHIPCPEEAVMVIFTEVAKDNWAFGGELASDCFKQSQ
jgi:4-oxalocrotonate tautomerase